MLKSTQRKTAAKQTARIAIVASTYNANYVDGMVERALDVLTEEVELIRVPGAFEIPGTIVQIMKNNSPDAIVALGAVIRGETPHFDYIAGESAKGIAEISRSSNIPIINGILTTDNAKQAEDRSKVGGRNKGWDAMEAAMQTIAVYQEIFSDSKC